MQLSRFSDYALRTLLYLSVNKNEKATLSTVSEYYDISLDHLRKVVHELAKLNYIRTYRGKNGGFELQHAPEDINIGEVLQQTEGMGPLLDCASQPCRLNSICTLKDILAEAQQAFFAALSQYTLADLLRSRKMQRELKVINIA